MLEEPVIQPESRRIRLSRRENGCLKQQQAETVGEQMCEHKAYKPLLHGLPVILASARQACPEHHPARGDAHILEEMLCCLLCSALQKTAMAEIEGHRYPSTTR